jgi:hypothetical protein
VFEDPAGLLFLDLLMEISDPEKWGFLHLPGLFYDQKTGALKTLLFLQV